MSEWLTWDVAFKTFVLVNLFMLWFAGWVNKLAVMVAFRTVGEDHRMMGAIVVHLWETVKGKPANAATSQDDKAA